MGRVASWSVTYRRSIAAINTVYAQRVVFRVIARLDVKPPSLVKGIHLEGFRRLGSPDEFARRYYIDGADEILYQDVVASLYGRNSIDDVLQESVSQVFIPKTVGGGVRSVADGTRLMRCGADRLSINTAAVESPGLIRELSNEFGRQAIVVTIEVKKREDRWMIMTNSGREHTSMTLDHWVTHIGDQGAGEIVLTSIDQEGTLKGFDLELLGVVRAMTDLPIVLHGGGCSTADVVRAAQLGANAVALASLLHYGHGTIGGIKQALASAGIEVRTNE